MAHNSIQRKNLPTCPASKSENGHGPSTNRKELPMNFEKLQKVRDIIAAKPEHFDMSDYFGLIPNNSCVEMPDYAGEYIETCGTVACIAGYTVAIFRPKDLLYETSSIASDILEISSTEADHIFMGSWSLNFLSDISIEETLWYLDGVLRTKNIFWNQEIEEYWSTDNDA